MGYYVFNPFTKKMDWTEAGGGGGPSFASIWTSQLSFGSATGGSMFVSTVSFSSITTSHCTLNKNIYNYINLTMFPNVSFASAKVDVNADAMVLTDSTGYTVYSSTVDLTVTMSVSGISGLMGSAEASSQWYHIWGISDGVNFTAILDSSPTSPTFPSGYSFKCYLGAVYNNSSGNFVNFKQKDNKVDMTNTLVLVGGTSVTYAEVDLSTFVPTTAKFVIGSYVIACTTAGTFVTTGYLAGDVNGIGEVYLQYTSYASSQISLLYGVPLVTPQKVYYKGAAGGAAWAVYLYLSCWQY